MYYVRRNSRIKGPLTRDKLRTLRQEGRLRMRDEVSASADGPWLPFQDFREEVLGGDDEVPQRDSGIWNQDSVLVQSADEMGSGGQPVREWQTSLQTWLEGEDPFRKPFRPLMYALGGMLLIALAMLALAIVFGPH